MHKNKIQEIPVAITGIGCLFPRAEDLRAYWANILNRVDAIGEVPAGRWDPDDYFDADPKAPDRTYARRGGFLSPVEFPPLEFGITPNSLEATDSNQLLGLLVARAALEDAGCDLSRAAELGRVSVVLGVTGMQQLVIPLGARLGHPIWRRALREAGISEEVAERVVQRITDSYVEWKEESFPGLLGNVVAGRIANRLNLKGTNCVVDAACASSLGALHVAMMELATGRCDVALSGGMDTFNDIFMYLCFSKTPALSPSGDARPFDARADGTILGEGSGCVVLKRLADAERDGDRIYAVLRAIGTSSDGKGHAIYAPSPEGQTQALRQAYELAGISPDTIELVEAHGTGTRAGDAAETAALAEVFRAARPESTWCALGSVKSQIGHTKAAAGAAGLIKAALALHHKVLPPTIKVTQPIEPVAPGNSPFYVNTEKRPWLPGGNHPRRAAVSSFGFGGSNYHCVLEEYRPEKTAIDWDGEIQIAAFSASDPRELQAKVSSWFQERDWLELRAAAQETRNAFRPEEPWRLVAVVRRGQDLAKTLAQIQQQWEKEPSARFWSLPEGVYFGQGNPPGKLAMLFPGQGSQYPGMLRDLACQFPQVLQALAEANACFSEEVSSPAKRPPLLSDFIYPHAAFSEGERRLHEEQLRATAIAQPALGAVSLGAFRALQYFGLRPDAVAGHSFGELTALGAAGRLSSRQLFQLANLRGRLMEQAGQKREHGGMLAVQLSAEQTEAFLRSERLGLVVANRNAPAQTVLSGSLPEIEQAAQRLQQRGIACRPLPVSAAFHSPLVAPVQEPFLAALQPLSLPRATMPVFANSTGQPYPDEPHQTRLLLAGQLARPVLFEELIRNLHATGVRTFLEVGPGNKLTGLVQSILQNQPHHAAAVDASSGKNAGALDLARLLALTAALGCPIQLERWDDTATRPKKTTAHTVQLTGANYRNPAKRSSQKVGQAFQPDLPSGIISKEMTMNNHKPLPPTSAQEKPAPSLNIFQESLLALQKLSEQTAQLHRQFLDGQDRALQVFQSLLQQQNVPHTTAALLPERPAAREIVIEKPAPAAPPIHVNGTPAEPEPVVPAPVSRPAEKPTLPPVALTAPALPEPAANGVMETLLDVVAEKTGYPTEMLNLDMELDADLGIDSIKRVEIFSALQEQMPQAPAIPSEQIPTLRTLGDVLAHLENGTTSRAQKVFFSEEGEQFTACGSAFSPLQSAKPQAAQTPLQRLVPKAIPLSLSRRKSQPLPSGAEVLIIDDQGDLTRRLVERLQLLGCCPRSCALQEALQMPDLSASALVLLAPAAGTTDAFLLDAFRLLQKMGPVLRRQAGTARLITVSRLDGGFGLLPGNSIADPVSGGLAGLLKTAAREWPEVGCKALDLSPAVDVDEAALAIAAELESEGPTEIGITPNGLVQIHLEPVSGSTSDEINLQTGDVLLVSGGARGITAEACVALARRFAPTFILLGRSPAPVPEPDWLAGLQAEQEIKQQLFQHAGRSLPPRELEQQFQQIMAAREMRHNLQRISDAGARVIYRQVDVRDFAAVQDLVRDLRQQCGPVRGLLHGAGIIADRRIEDKTPDQFRAVYETKVTGLRNLLRALDGEPLQLLVLFSSSTARYGRIGQADYAAANEVLNKLAQAASRQRPGCKVVSINWGPWAGGMVTEGLQKVFHDEGIHLIPLAAGARLLAEEISRPAAQPVELVILAQEPAGDVASSSNHQPKTTAPLSCNFSRQVSLERCPVLRSHVLNGQAVVPVVLHLEWLAHGALHANPGLAFHGFDDLRILKGVKIDETQSCKLDILTGKGIRQHDQYLVPAEIHQQTLDGKTILHSRATIVLASRLPAAPETIALEAGMPYSRSVAEAYNSCLFHGPQLQGIRRIESVSASTITGTVTTAPPPARWLVEPLRASWLAEPLVLDASFQLLVLWCWENCNMPLLPTAIGSYRQYCRSFPAGEIRVRARVSSQAHQHILADLDYLDAGGKLLARLLGSEWIRDASLKDSYRRNRLPVPSHTS